MMAIVQDHYGSEDSLALDDVDRPRIEDDEVLVRVHAASVHVGDWMLMTGVPKFMRLATGLQRPKNRVPGTDVAGTVEAVGKDVTKLRPGDEVFGWCTGAFAEYARASENQFVRKRPTSPSSRRRPWGCRLQPHSSSYATRARSSRARKC